MDPEGTYSSLLKESKENLGRDVKMSVKQNSASTREGLPSPSPTPRDPTQEDAKCMMTIQVYGYNV